MSDVTKNTIKEIMKGRSEEHRKIILYLAELLKGEEDTINEYVKN